LLDSLLQERKPKRKKEEPKTVFIIFSMDNSDKNGLPYKYDALCKTDVKSEKFTFAWRITDFCSRTEKCGEILTSEEFTIKEPGNKITKWHGEIYPRGYNHNCSDFLSVYITKQSAEEVDAHCILYSLNVNMVKKKISEFTDVRKFHGDSWGWEKAIKRSDLSQHTPDGILTLFFEITIMGKTKKTIEYAKSGDNFLVMTENYHHKQLAHDVQTLFLSKDHSDVIVRCGEKVYDCHKFMLTSRSPVFKNMFESDMKEKVNGEVEIKNMDHEVLEDLLKYIYSGVAPNIDEHVQELFDAADQYQLEKLKELCEVKLCSGLDTKNCVDLLILGYLHNAQKLKAAALEYLSKNMQKMNTIDWTQSLIAHPILMAEVMVMMAPKNDDEHN